MNRFLRALSLAKRGGINLVTNRPLCVSFEITHDCNANCKHCHRGGIVDTARATPERFGELYRELRPVVIQVSGGEPLLRSDVEEIIAALKQPDGTPYIVFVTNAALLTVEKYHRLRDIGVDVFSVSFDYPDERHDEFRAIPGLFRRIESLAKGIDSGGNKAVTLNSVVQRDNFRELVPMAEIAADWGLGINYSPYTWLRTDDRGYMIPRDELPEFERVIRRLIDFKKRYGAVRTTDSFFYDMLAFFRNGSIPDCRAGERFLVVNPDGTLSPCGLIITDYPTWDELKDGFTRNNTCTFCHTCIRSSTENPFNNLITGAVQTLNR